MNIEVTRIDWGVLTKNAEWKEGIQNVLVEEKMRKMTMETHNMNQIMFWNNIMW